MRDADWSDAENDALVAEHFAMLAQELAGQPCNKAAHNRTLQARIGRTRSAIEFKHRNLGAVLLTLGEDWVRGYAPLFNRQTSLVDAALRWLQRHPDWQARPPAWQATGQFAEPPRLYIDPPPTLRNTPPPQEAELAMAVARRFDVAERDARNRALGRAGEELALTNERLALRDCGRADLAARVRWISEEEGDGAGYDIASFAPDGSPRLVEVKTTNGWERTPFHISRNELAVSEAEGAHWCLLRLWNFARSVKAFELRPPLSRHVELIATSYRASLH